MDAQSADLIYIVGLTSAIEVIADCSRSTIVVIVDAKNDCGCVLRSADKFSVEYDGYK